MLLIFQLVFFNVCQHLITEGKNEKKQVIRFMTFNTWHMGDEVNQGLEKVAKHIVEINPDILGLQEVMNHTQLENLLKLLGSEWRKCTIHDRRTTILTKLKVTQQYTHEQNSWNSGCSVRLVNGFIVNIWNVHLDWKNFSTLAACKTRPPDQVDLMHRKGMDVFHEEIRLKEIKDMMKHKPLVNHMVSRVNQSTILMGDFNAPSHLDWTPNNKKANCGWAFNWPVSQEVEKYGFIDSFRFLHPSATAEPGNTWSTVFKSKGEQRGWKGPEPQARIDFIYYIPSERSEQWKPIRSFVYNGSQVINEAPNYKNNDWPSDHSAVVTDFVLAI